VDQGAPVTFFRWSPMADSLAYLVGSGVLHLRIIAAGSSEATVLKVPSPAASPGSLAGSPDGDALAYVWTGLHAGRGIHNGSHPEDQVGQLFETRAGKSIQHGGQFA
jgi:hypothetical protein